MKRPTIKDVAQKAGVSISVVSYVLNETPGQTIPEPTRTKIKNAAEELNYKPNAIARGMRTKKSLSIALVSFWDVTLPVVNQVFNGILKTTDTIDYNVLFCNLAYSDDIQKNEFRYVDLFNSQMIDGVLLFSPFELTHGFNEHIHVEKIKANNIPAVIMNGYTHDKLLNYVYLDYHNTSLLNTLF
jgi:LacI family transcriptional regulator